MNKTVMLVGMVAASAACGKSGAVTAEKACEHAASIAETSVEKCLEEMADIKKELGEEKFGEFTSCVVKAKKTDDLALCVPKKDMQEYMNKSKATEAKVSLRMIADGARAYYMDAPVAEDLGMAPAEPSLPESVGPTPAKGSCCGDLGKCAPDVAHWEHPSWQALSFSMYDPHYYSYEFKRNDDGRGFVVSAYGDLDCDGTFSTYALTGVVDDSGEINLGQIESTEALE